MIAADTSAWIDYFKGVSSHKSIQLEHALLQGTLVMPIPVLFEIISSPEMSASTTKLISQLPRLDYKPEFWERAASLRKSLLKKSFKARSMDCLIAQSCLDHDVPLIASDHDYRHFIKSGLALI